MKLETERLILRPMEESDAHAIYHLRSDPEVTFNLLSDTQTEDEAASWAARCLDAVTKKRSYPMAIILKKDDRFIGMCGLFRISWEHMNAELVYWLGKPYWGHGYMTEAAERMVKFGFEEIGLERISADCFTRNRASARVIEKLGFTYEGCARHEYKKGDMFVDTLRFAIIRSDYEDRTDQ